MENNTIPIEIEAFEFLENLVYIELGIKGEHTFVHEFFNSIEDFFEFELSPLKAAEKLDTSIKINHDFVSDLQLFDKALTAEGSPSWEDHDNTWQVKQQLLENSFIDLVIFDDFQHCLANFTVLAVSMLGGHGRTWFGTFDYTYFLTPFAKLKPQVIAWKLSQEYATQTTFKSLPEGINVSPIDLEQIPIFLVDDNPNVSHIDGNYYLTEDIIKAMTATSGMAQALERQDLEGPPMTGAANYVPRKVSKTKFRARQEDDGSDDEENEDDGDLESEKK